MRGGARQSPRKRRLPAPEALLRHSRFRNYLLLPTSSAPCDGGGGIILHLDGIVLRLMSLMWLQLVLNNINVGK